MSLAAYHLVPLTHLVMHPALSHPMLVQIRYSITILKHVRCPDPPIIHPFPCLPFNPVPIIPYGQQIHVANNFPSSTYPIQLPPIAHTPQLPISHNQPLPISHNQPLPIPHNQNLPIQHHQPLPILNTQPTPRYNTRSSASFVPNQVLPINHPTLRDPYLGLPVPFTIPIEPPRPKSAHPTIQAPIFKIIHLFNLKFLDPFQPHQHCRLLKRPNAYAQFKHFPYYQIPYCSNFTQCTFPSPSVSFATPTNATTSNLS